MTLNLTDEDRLLLSEASSSLHVIRRERQRLEKGEAGYKGRALPRRGGTRNGPPAAHPAPPPSRCSTPRRRSSRASTARSPRRRICSRGSRASWLRRRRRSRSARSGGGGGAGAGGGAGVWGGSGG